MTLTHEEQLARQLRDVAVALVRTTSERDRLGALIRGIESGIQELQSQIAIQNERRRLTESLVGAANQNEDFVRATSRLLLGRDADSNMLSFFQNLMQNTNASAAALTMMQSQEFRTLTTSGFFQSLLGRNLDDAGKSFFTSLPPNVGAQGIVTMIADSDEFFGKGKHH